MKKSDSQKVPGPTSGCIHLYGIMITKCIDNNSFIITDFYFLSLLVLSHKSFDLNHWNLFTILFLLLLFGNLTIL